MYGFNRKRHSALEFGLKFGTINNLKMEELSMLSYGIFKEILVDNIKKYMPAEYQDYPLKVEKLERANMVVDGISFAISDGISPSIHINDVYESYRECESMEAVLRAAAEKMVKEYERISKKGSLPDFAVKENVLMKLINTGMNQELLAHCPHREVMDLSVVYYWAVAMDEEGIATALITNENVGSINATEEELFELATQNVKRLTPTKINGLSAMLDFSMEGLHVDGDFAFVKPDNDMIMVTNERYINGAVAMLDDEALHKIAESLKGNLHILPSSIHEVLVIKAEEGREKELAQMVANINQTEVPLGDRLSDNVYFYDRLKRKLTMATGAPEINLDQASQSVNKVSPTTPKFHMGR